MPIRRTSIETGAIRYGSGFVMSETWMAISKKTEYLPLESMAAGIRSSRGGSNCIWAQPREAESAFLMAA